MSKQYVEVTYRDIAKMFASALPVEGSEFSLKVAELLEVVKAMPKEQKLALKMAYIFSSKVPREDREDMFQELALTVFKARTKDEKLAYSIARCDWSDWWRKQFTKLEKVCLLNGSPRQENYSACSMPNKPTKCRECAYRGYRGVERIDSIIEDNEGSPVRLAELIVGEVEFENKVCADIECKRIWRKLPDSIKPIIHNRLIGKALTAVERKALSRYVHQHGASLLLA